MIHLKRSHYSAYIDIVSHQCEPFYVLQDPKHVRMVFHIDYIDMVFLQNVSSRGLKDYHFDRMFYHTGCIYMASIQYDPLYIC